MITVCALFAALFPIAQIIIYVLAGFSICILSTHLAINKWIGFLTMILGCGLLIFVALIEGQIEKSYKEIYEELQEAKKELNIYQEKQPIYPPNNFPGGFRATVELREEQTNEKH